MVMKRSLTLSLLASLLLAAVARAQVPQVMHYQGRILVGNNNFNGSGHFKFALVDPGGTTLWNNDGTGIGMVNNAPVADVTINCDHGLYSVMLGETPAMVAIPINVFSHADVRLRVWFSDNQNGFQQFVPDQKIASVGYAMMAAAVMDGAITAAKLADGAVTTAKLAPGAVTSAILADDLTLGSTNVYGKLDIYRTAANTPAISLLGANSQISTYGSDGQEQTRLWGVTYGELLLNNDLSNNATAVRLSAYGGAGGRLELRNTNGQNRALLHGANTGGALTLYQADGGVGVFVDGEFNGAGLMDVRNTNGSTMVRIAGDQGGRLETIGSINLMETIGGDAFVKISKNGSGGGGVRTLDEFGNTTTFLASTASGGGGFLNVHMNNSIWPGVTVDGDDGNSGSILLKAANDSTRIVLDAHNGASAEFSMRHPNNVETIEILASESGSDGSQIEMRNSLGNRTVQLDAEASVIGGGGFLALYKGDGSASITLSADQTGEGRITTQVLQITGGSDLSEQFNVNAVNDVLKPGMIVSIDPENPGELTLSTNAYDRTVAGVLSGAGGVKPGMLMGQAGTAADGKHPVALTGRVYCQVDASNGAIRPGDLLTTSETPGHAMKVTDHARAQGAIIGKAMSSLQTGKGLVLVLISLQ
jgi:hypothetical protein